MAETLPAGVTPLPPGVVSMEDAVRGQASMSGQAPRMNLGEMYSEYVASPLTQLVSKVVPASPFQNPLTYDPTYGTQAVAKTVVPQNLTELAIAGATAGAGGLAGKMGLTGAKAAATRIGGAVMGGMAGKAADEGDVNAGTLARGGGQGLVSGLTGEAIGAGIEYARKAGVQRAAQKIQTLDASDAANAIRSNPKLQGVFKNVDGSPEGLRDLALGTVPDPDNPGKVIGKGEAMLKTYLDQQDALINQQIQQVQQKLGRTYQFPDPYQPGKFVPYDEARRSLSKLGNIAGKIKSQQEVTVAGERLNGGEVKELYAETLRAWQQQLSRVSPQALQAFNESRGATEAGYATLDLLKKAFKQKVAGRIAFNSDVLEGVMADKQKELTNKLGEPGFWSLAKALRISPERIGQQDVMNPTGLMSQAAGVLPLPGAAYLRVHVGSPQLVGNPFALGNAGRTAIDVGASQMLGRGLDFSPSAGQVAGAAQNLFTMPIQQQGLPLK